MIWKIIYCLVWIWQLPQNIIGLALLVLHSTRPKHIGTAGFKFIQTKILPCCCLGEYLYIGNTNLIRFTYGRGILSRILGPLFLPVITIPSIITLMMGKEIYFLQLYATKWSIKLGKK